MKLRINLNENCNNNCITCSAKNKIVKDDIKKILHTLKKNKEKIEKISLLGGEPTIDKNFLRILKICKENNIKISLTSNGRIFSDEIFTKKCKMLGLKDINISIYGEKLIHEKITRVKNSYNETIKGINNLIKYDIKTDINLVVSKFNQKEIIDMINNYKDKKIKIILLHPIGNANKSHIPSLLDMINTFQKIKNNSNISIIDFPFCTVPKKHHNKIYFKKGYNSLNSKVTIDSKIKTDKCKQCTKNNICQGIYSEYNNEEFKKCEPILH